MFISQKDVDVVDPVVLVPREERNLAFDGRHSDVFIDDTHQLRALLFETSRHVRHHTHSSVVHRRTLLVPMIGAVTILKVARCGKIPSVFSCHVLSSRYFRASVSLLNGCTWQGNRNSASLSRVCSNKVGLQKPGLYTQAAANRP